MEPDEKTPVSESSETETKCLIININDGSFVNSQDLKFKEIKCSILRKAYQKDNFEAFENILKRNFTQKKQCLNLFCRIEIDWNCIKDILNSNNKNDTKYICSIMINYKSLDEEMFSKAFNDNSETFLSFAFLSGKAESFLSFFMPDWLGYGSTSERNCTILEKSQQFVDETRKNFAETICEMIDDDKNQIYRDVLFKLLHRYLNELEKQPQAFSELPSIEIILRMRNQEYKEKILKVIMIYWKVYDTDFCTKIISCAKSKEFDTFFNLSVLLKTRKISKFHEAFETFVRSCKLTFGEYYKTLLNHEVQLLIALAKRQNFHNVIAFVGRSFPLGENPNQNFISEEILHLRIFNILPLKIKELNDLVSNYLEILLKTFIK